MACAVQQEVKKNYASLDSEITAIDTRVRSLEDVRDECTLITEDVEETVGMAAIDVGHKCVARRGHPADYGVI